MSERMEDRGERAEDAIGDLELGAEQAAGVKGGVEPINDRRAEPINDGKVKDPIKG